MENKLPKVVFSFGNKIKTIISNQCGIPISELKADADLKRDLNLTDLEIADLFQYLEDEFKTRIPREVSQSAQTIGDIITYLCDHLDEFKET